MTEALFAFAALACSVGLGIGFVLIAASLAKFVKEVL